MDIKLLKDRVLVKVAKEKEKSQGGIINPMRQYKSEGVVVATGPGVPLKDKSVRAVSVKAKDYVYFDSARGYVLMLDNVKHVVIREDDIMAVTG